MAATSLFLVFCYLKVVLLLRVCCLGGIGSQCNIWWTVRWVGLALGNRVEGCISVWLLAFNCCIVSPPRYTCSLPGYLQSWKVTFYLFILFLFPWASNVHFPGWRASDPKGEYHSSICFVSVVLDVHLVWMNSSPKWNAKDFNFVWYCVYTVGSGTARNHINPYFCISFPFSHLFSG